MLQTFFFRLTQRHVNVGPAIFILAQFPKGVFMLMV